MERLPRRRPVEVGPGGGVADRAGASGRPAALAARAHAFAVRLSAQPAEVALKLLAATAALAAIGIPLGLALRGDQAAVFRELMPATWLSFAELLAIAAAAWAVHAESAARVRWHESFWGVAAAAFCALALVEIAQPTVFFAHWLRDSLAVPTPLGLADLDAFLLILMLAGVAAALAVRAGALLHHPRAAALLALGVAFGVASQALDATLPATRWEFVVEESLKLAAWPILLAGFLVALRDVRR